MSVGYYPSTPMTPLSPYSATSPTGPSNWYRLSSTKRKRTDPETEYDASTSSSGDEGGMSYPRKGKQVLIPPAPTTRAFKRPRRSVPAGVEGRFADMSIRPVYVMQTRESESNPPPPTPEVEMKTRSWYEPEKDRIVVTDLDGSDNESEPHDQNPEFEVSKAYLSQLRNSPPTPSPSFSHAGALVLYKPLSIPPNPPRDPMGWTGPDDDGIRVEETDEEDDGPPLYATIEEVENDEDEDVEMMEVDED